MHAFPKIALASALFFSPVCAGYAQSNADDLPLTRVVATTSGLALYEHRGVVRGNAEIPLSVRLDRVDDMLKSLVVFDEKGRLGGVSLAGKEPLSQIFRDFPFTQDDLTALKPLLESLRGAEVSLEGEKIQGRLLTITEETESTDKGLITRHRLGILTPNGIQTARLESLSALEFTDPAVHAQLERALAALFAGRVQDRRTLTVSLIGNGQRPVGLAYLQDAPLWKSSYRLVLPKPDSESALIQGWAIMENTTGQNWKDVSVTLMSGSPVTYRQALYESYHIDRPTLPVRVMDRVLPRRDDGAIVSARKERRQSESPPMPAAVLGRAAGGMTFSTMDAEMSMETVADSYSYTSQDTMAQIISAQAGETAAHLLFTFPQPVTLAAGHSLMVPFLSHELPAESLYVYQPETNAAHPLASVRIENKSDTSLPPGILTLFDSATGLVHVGDADMPLLPRGESRYVSFALDTKTAIDRQVHDTRKHGVITISKGTLHQNVLSRARTVYTIKAPADEPRKIIIEHPRRTGWTLIEPALPESGREETRTHYRLGVDVPAGETRTVTVILEHKDTESIALVHAAPHDLDTRMAAFGSDMPADLRKALEKVKELRASVSAIEQEIRRLQAERGQIFADQERLRQNIQAVSTENRLGKRYIDELEKQEDRLAALLASEQTLQRNLNAANKALSDYVHTLRF